MQAKRPPFAVALINLGTPESPEPAAVRRYLKPFLSDRRVVDAPRLLWWFILNGIILRFRPRRIAKLYASIWTSGGSPLLVNSRALATQLEKNLATHTGEHVPVFLAMTYGEPSVASLGRQMRQLPAGTPLVVLPMFPQYSSSTTAAVFDALANALKHCPDIPELHFIRDYGCNDSYVEALSNSIKRHWETHPRGEKLLFSFHGIPESYQQKGDPYPDECQATARAVAARLGLSEAQYAVSFQSRFGKREWVKPYTDVLLAEWAGKGIRHIDVICPGFATDCLETLEEIAVENREHFLSHGGHEYRYIPCLNDHPDHARALTDVVIGKMPASPMK